MVYGIIIGLVVACGFALYLAYDLYCENIEMQDIVRQQDNLLAKQNELIVYIYSQLNEAIVLSENES